MLPHSSVAVHTLRITPALPPQSPNAPLFWSTKLILMAPTSLQLSVAVASPVPAGLLSASQLIVRSGAHTITGALTSTTVIIC